MSDEEQSADNKSFLARWSQRKHEAKQPDRDAPTVNADAPSGPVAESDVAQEFDLSSLPKLEDMTATTDITAFSARVVPNICAMRRCENPGRWIPRSAITSILRSTTPTTGIRRAAYRAVARSDLHGCRAAGFANYGRRSTVEPPLPAISSKRDSRPFHAIP